MLVKVSDGFGLDVDGFDALELEFVEYADDVFCGVLDDGEDGAVADRGVWT